MKQFIANHLEQSYAFTNNQVENIKKLDHNFNKSHTSKLLLAQIEVYKAIIDSLLEKNKYYKVMLDDTIEDLR